MQSSYFDGKVLHHVGLSLLAAVISVITLGIGFPFGYYMLLVWETQHTVINGHRLQYVGTVWNLFFQWLKWWLLTLVTLGIYGFWLPVRVKQFVTKHTQMQDAVEPVAVDPIAAEPADTSAPRYAAVDRVPQGAGLGLDAVALWTALGLALMIAGIVITLKFSWAGVLLMMGGLAILGIEYGKV